MKFRLSLTEHFTLSTWLRCCVGILFSTHLALAADTPVKSTHVATLEDKRINESSGLAIGLRNPGVFWTLNDSGGGPFIYAFNREGKNLTRCEILGAANFDWEEIASGPGADGQPALYLADIGDNLLFRAQIVIYRIAEPLIDTAAAPAETQARDVVKLTAAYPDGSHNAEAILCHPKTGRLHIITKSDDGKCGVYSLPETVTADGVMKMERIAAIEFPALARSGKRTKDNCMSTAACFAPDASRIAVCTYSSIYEWTIPAGGGIAAAFAAPPRRIEQPLLPQSEALCYDPDSRSIWITSERLPTPLWRVEVGGKSR